MTINRRALPLGATTGLTLLVLVGVFAQQAHAQITITSPTSSPSGPYAGVFTAQAGQVVKFTGTMANNTADTLYDYQIFYLVGKNSNDFSFVGATGTLNFGQTTSAIPLGSLGINKATPAGAYVFYLDAQGTDGPGDPSDVSSNYYLLNIPAAAPEPSAWTGLGIGLLSLGGLTLRVRSRRAQA